MKSLNDGVAFAAAVASVTRYWKYRAMGAAALAAAGSVISGDQELQVSSGSATLPERVATLALAAAVFQVIAPQRAGILASSTSEITVPFGAYSVSRA